MTKTKTIAVGTTFKVGVHVRNMICAGTWWSISPLRRMYPCSPAVDLTSLCSLTSGYHSWGGEEAVVPKDFHPRRQDEGKTSLIHVHMHRRVYKLASSHPVVLFFVWPNTSMEFVVFRESCVVLCRVYCVDSFQWTRHIMQRGGACRVPDRPAQHTPSVSVHKGSNGLTGSAHYKQEMFKMLPI